MYKDVLLRRRHPLVEDGPAPLEGHRPGRLQRERQGLGRPQQVSQHVHGVDRLLLEQREDSDRSAVSIIVASTVAAPTTGEGDGIGAVSVRLLGEQEKRVLPGAREDGGADEGEPAGGKDRRRGEAAGQGLAYPEQAEAMTGDGFNPPRPGDIGIARRGRLVPVG